MRHARRGRLVKMNGEKCQMASFGQTSRMPPPAKPQPTANGNAAHSPTNERRKPKHAANGCAGVGAGDEAREERAFHRQVRGVVVQQQTRTHAGRQRDAEAEGEDQPIRPGAPLEDEDVPEPPVSHQHRRQRRHDGHFDQQRRQEEVLGRQQSRALHGFT